MRIFRLSTVVKCGFIFGLTLLYVLGAGTRPWVVQAHAVLVSASPAPDSVLTTRPTTITLNFSERVSDGSSFILTNEDFQEIPVQIMLDDERDTVMWAEVPPLADGLYTVQWLLLANDGHYQSETYNFRIETGEPLPGEAGSWWDSITAVEHSGGWLGMGAVGLLALLTVGWVLLNRSNNG